METKTSLAKSLKKVKQVAIELQGISHELRVSALRSMAQAMRENSQKIIIENKLDLEEARKSGLGSSLLERLSLDQIKIEEMARGLESIIKLDDPIGVLNEQIELDEGLVLDQVSCPLGVLAIIFESRPDVVPQVMGLSLKSCNAVVFKGGSEARLSNKVLFEILEQAGIEAGLPEGFALILESRDQVLDLLALDGLVDLVIPRGSNSLVRFIMENTKIPVLGHADGICSIYLDQEADQDLALRVIHDSKVQYPAVCNAIENLLVHRVHLDGLLPRIVDDLELAGVEIRGDAEVCRIKPSIKPASSEDWETEYNDLVLSVKLVDSLDEAIEFINSHGSGHTDGIITLSESRAELFAKRVDSSSVMLNASTRFADGFRYGKGAEIGISTNKTHARGPVGLEGLVIYKYILRGKGQVVANYVGEKAKPFKHQRII